MAHDWTGGDRNLCGLFWLIYLVSWPAAALGTEALWLYVFTWTLCLLITIARPGSPIAKVMYILEAGVLFAMPAAIAVMPPAIS